MLDRLLAWCARYGDESPWMLQVRSFSDGHEGWTLLLEGHDPDDEDADDVVWEIRADGVRDYVLRGPTVESIALTSEHPLLLQHAAPPAELHVGAPPQDADRLFARLVRAHRDLVGSWVPLDEVMTDHPALTGKPVEGEATILARGPLPLIQAYAPVAEAEGMQPRVMRGQLPPGVGSEPPWVLLLDESWCVATRFTCRQLAAD
jgi:hypothetical protein